MSDFWIFILICCVCGGIGAAWEAFKEDRENAAGEKLKAEQPEIWRQQELLKLEKERLEVEREQAKQESRRRNVGLAVGLARIFLGK